MWEMNYEAEIENSKGTKFWPLEMVFGSDSIDETEAKILSQE